MDAVEVAVERMHKAYATYRDVQVESNKASAEVLRLVFLGIVDEYPSKIKGLSFSSEYCYDDEGGYFRSDSVFPLESGCTAEVDGFDEYVLHDLDSYGHEALCLLCNVHEDSFEGQVTVQEARERRF